MPDKESIQKWLREIPDPEIPVINLEELGVIRDIIIQGEKVEVVITPTYTGCPAMKVMEEDIIKKLQEHRIKEVKVSTVLSPAWTTDWIGEEAREKLRKYGISPPEHSTVNKAVLMGKAERIVRCPRCNSTHSKMINQFGSTPCKALYKCEDCLEAFDYFKCI